MLAVRDVARLLSCSVRSIYTRARERSIPPPVKIGGLSRWNRAELQQWIDDGCKPLS